MENKEIKSVKKVQDVPKKNNDIFKHKTRIKPYVSFENRVFVFTILTFLFLIISLLYLSSSLKFNEEKIVNYRENSNIDYKVYLKDNDFYETNYLGKGMVYVANLIDHVSANFDYKFKIDEESDVNFEYDVVAKLQIKDNESNKTYFEKDYTILKKSKESIRNKNNYNLNKSVRINYNYYNNLANKFRQRYGVDAKSDLVVNMKIRMKSIEGSNLNLKDSSNMSLTIPLSKSAVNINLSSNELNKNSNVTSEKSCEISNYTNLYIAIVLFIFSVIFGILVLKYIFKLKKHRSPYDKYISKILNEYDRLIVETTTKSDANGKNIVEVREFKELLDVRDNLNLPIKYHVISKNEKCEFYINHEDEVYIYTVKKVDIENK